MKNMFILTVSLFAVLSVNAQENFRQKMIDSGEKQEEISNQFKSRSTDLAAFVRTKAWNISSRTPSRFSNIVELDMPIIGGRVRSSLVDKDENIALIAPSGGGIWTFDPEKGTYFNPLDDFGSFLTITYLTQDPKNPKIILAGTGDEKHGTAGHGIFKSIDGGKNFALIPSTNPELNRDFEYIRFVKISPELSNIIYFTSHNKLYKSTNTGESWELVFTANYPIRSLMFTKNTGVMLAVDKQGIFISKTGNTNSFSLVLHTALNELDEDQLNIDGVVVATQYSNRALAYAFFILKGNKAEIYKTLNNGKTWVKVSQPNFYIGQPWFCLTIGIHPFNPDIIIAGSVGWGYSTDGGKSWTDGAELEVDFHDVHFHPSNPDVAYLGYDQGVGRVDFSNYINYSVWRGTTYKDELQPEQLELGKNPGFNTSQIYYGDFYPEEYGDSHLFGQQDGGCFAQINNIEKRIMAGDGGSVFVNKQDPNFTYISIQNGNLSKTSSALNLEKGAYYYLKNIPDEHAMFITQFAGNNADGNQIYIPQKTSIIRTINGGKTFESIATHTLTKGKITVEDTPNPIVYLMGIDKEESFKSKVIRIENAATNSRFTELLIQDNGLRNGYIDHVNICPNDNNAIYTTYDNGAAFKISDLDTNNPIKESIRGNIQDVTFNTVIGIKNQPNLLLAGTNTGLFYSENSGKTWTINTDIPFTQITDLKFRNTDKRLFIFTYGRGVWAVTLDTETLTIPKITQNDIHIYPNPSSNKLSIKMESYIDTTVELFDSKGSFVLDSKTPDNVDISNLTPGMYILHVKQHNTKLLSTSKIIIN